MTEAELRALNELDLSKLTIADLRGVRNVQVRMALSAALTATLVADEPEHTSHGQHTSHLKSHS
jgi:hypothetical protein